MHHHLIPPNYHLERFLSYSNHGASHDLILKHGKLIFDNPHRLQVGEKGERYSSLINKHQTYGKSMVSSAKDFSVSLFPR